MYLSPGQHHDSSHGASQIQAVSATPIIKKRGRFYLRIRSQSSLLVLLLSTLVCLISLTSGALAAQITLAWEASDSGPDGYRVYQRMEDASYNYDQPAWTGSQTTATIDGLADETTYYFIVRAYEGEAESGDSNEVGYTTPAAEDSSEDQSDNQAPVADAGNNQTVTSQTQVTLDGSGSSDPENQSLTYQWSQTSGQTVTISESTAAVATFVAPEPTGQSTTLAFELTVTDPDGLSSADTCLVLVTSAASSTDSDGDGVPDASDAFPEDPDEWEDADGNGTGDNADAIANHAPEQPSIISPEDGDTVSLRRLEILASTFADSDSEDQHASTQWLMSTFDEERDVVDFTSTSRFLEKLWIPWIFLDPATTYTCKVRYFDAGGLASEWSQEISFTTSNRLRRDSTATDQTTDDTSNNDEDTIQSTATYDGQAQISIRIVDSQTDAAITAVSAFDPEDFEEGEGALFDTGELTYGMLGYRIEVPEPGQSVTVQLSYSEPIDEQMQWYRYSNSTGLQICSDSIQLNADENSIERQLTDGGEADADGTTNGIIVDIVGPRSVSASDSGSGTGLDDSDSSATGGSGSGCFLQSIIPYRKTGTGRH